MFNLKELYYSILSILRKNKIELYNLQKEIIKLEKRKFKIKIADAILNEENEKNNIDGNKKILENSSNLLKEISAKIDSNVSDILNRIKSIIQEKSKETSKEIDNTEKSKETSKETDNTEKSKETDNTDSNKNE
jgi:hypothetical protein